MTKPTALIVEDNPLLSDIFSKALRGADYITQIVNDGQSALNRLDNRVPDLLVLDMHLPGVSGPQVLQQIKSDSRYNETRIVIVTADVELASQLSSQVDETMVKPVGVKELQAVAKRLKAPVAK